MTILGINLPTCIFYLFVFHCSNGHLMICNCINNCFIRFPFRHSVYYDFECVYLHFSDILDKLSDSELWVDARLAAWFFTREGV